MVALHFELISMSPNFRLGNFRKDACKDVVFQSHDQRPWRDEWRRAKELHVFFQAVLNSIEISIALIAKLGL